jgi:hypothetical protein
MQKRLNLWWMSIGEFGQPITNTTLYGLPVKNARNRLGDPLSQNY